MPVMAVRKVRMRMSERFVRVRMPMASSGRDRLVVFMLVMLVVDVPVVMGHRIVGVLVLVLFRPMKPDDHSHQCAGHDK